MYWTIYLGIGEGMDEIHLKQRESDSLWHFLCIIWKRLFNEYKMDKTILCGYIVLPNRNFLFVYFGRPEASCAHRYAVG